MFLFQTVPPSNSIDLVTTWGGVVAFLVLAGGLFAIWRNLGKRTDDLGKEFKAGITKTETAISKTETAISKTEMAISKTEMAISKTEMAISKTETALSERIERVENRVSDRFTRVEDRLIKAFYAIFGKGPVSSQSPLALNDLGRAITQEIQGAKWASRVAPTLASWLKGKDAYQIQEHCFEFAEHFTYTDDELRTIRQSAYDHGLPIEQIHRVFAIELRDKLLEMAGGLEPPA